MKAKLSITAAVAAAMSLTACGAREPSYNDGWNNDNDTVVCTDRKGRRVPDWKCKKRYSGGGSSYAFVWFYMNRGGYVPAYGQAVNRRYGSYRPLPGRSYYNSSRSFSAAKHSYISRGGFGSTGRSSGFSTGG